MSSVGSSDSSQRAQDKETIRRTREEAKKTESELVKKQAQELRRVNEHHYAELEKLKQDHSNQMENFHHEAGQEISARDHRYQKDIEDIRALHRKETQRAADENMQKSDLVKNSIESDSTSQKKNADRRFENLNEDYKKKIDQMNERFESTLNETREGQSAAIDRNRKALQKAHETELKAVREERDHKVSELSKQYADYRGFVTEERKEGEVRNLQQNKRQSESLMHAVSKERQSAQTQAEIMRDGFKDSLEDTRDRFEKAHKNEQQAMRMSENDLKSTAVDRIDGQVRRLELANRDLKDASVQDQLKRDASKKQEVKNIRDAFTKNIENYKDQRDEILHGANAQNAKDISKVSKDFSKREVDTNRFYRGKMAEQNQIFKSAYDNIKTDFEARNDEAKGHADGRIKHIIEDSNQDKAKLTEMNLEQHASSQRSRIDDLKNLRAAMTTEKEEAVNRLQERLRAQENQHTDRMSQVVSKYEKTINQLKDQMFRDKKASEENTKRLTEELTKVNKMSVDQVESKNKEKLRMLNSQHSEELRSLNKRHEEKLDQVIGEMKKS